jgi:hypothetical protein
MARLRWLFVGALLVTAQAGVEFLTFGVDQIQGSRDDLRILADLSGEYRFVDWLALTAQFSFLKDDPDFVYTFTASDPRDARAPDPAKFTAAEAWLGIRAFL